MKFRVLIALLAIYLPLFTPVHAQSGSSVNVHLRLFGWDDGNSDLNYWDGKKDVNVQLQEGSRSVFYDYKGPSTFVLYRIQTDAKGKTVRVPAAQADLSNGGPWPLILLFKNQAAAGSYTAQVMPDDLKSFPPATYKFANCTSVIVGGEFAGQAFQLQPGEVQLLRANPAPGASLFVSLYTQAGGNQNPIYTNNWGFNSHMRTMVFVKQGDNSASGIVARRVAEGTVFPASVTGPPGR